MAQQRYEVIAPFWDNKHGKQYLPGDPYVEDEERVKELQLTEDKKGEPIPRGTMPPPDPKYTVRKAKLKRLAREPLKEDSEAKPKSTTKKE